VGLGVNTSLNIITPIETRTIIISEKLYDKFKEHSQKYYDFEPYETILENLIDFYEKNNERELKYCHRTN